MESRKIIEYFLEEIGPGRLFYIASCSIIGLGMGAVIGFISSEKENK